MQDLGELVDVVAAFEEGFAAEEFGEDAADGPDVDLRVLAWCLVTSGEGDGMLLWRNGGFLDKGQP